MLSLEEYNKTLHDAINKFGSKCQKSKFIEELSEVVQAFIMADFDNIAEEIADSEIMTDQIAIVLKIDTVADQIYNAPSIGYEKIKDLKEQFLSHFVYFSSMFMARQIYELTELYNRVHHLKLILKEFKTIYKIEKEVQTYKVKKIERLKLRIAQQ